VQIKLWARPTILVLIWVLATAYTLSELATVTAVLQSGSPPLARDPASLAPPMLRHSRASTDRPGRRAAYYRP
jgi:hypothetical protein